MERRKSGCCVFSRIELDEEPEEKVAARWLSSATANDRNKWMATHGAGKWNRWHQTSLKWSRSMSLSLLHNGWSQQRDSVAVRHTKRSTNGRLMMANVIHTLIDGQLLPFCIIHANECSGTKWIGKHSNHLKTPFTRWRRFSENGSRWRGEINSIKTTNRCGCTCIVANISADYFDMDHVLTCLVRRMELHLTFTPSIFLSVTGSRTGMDSNKLAFGSSEIRPDFICCRYWTAGFRVDMMLLLHYFSVYDEINLLFITFFP